MVQAAVIGRADVHTGAAAHRVEALEDLDLLGGVLLLPRQRLSLCRHRNPPGNPAPLRRGGMNRLAHQSRPLRRPDVLTIQHSILERLCYVLHSFYHYEEDWVNLRSACAAPIRLI